MKASFRTTRTQVSQPIYAGNVADTSELQAHHCIIPQQWTRLLCSVTSETKTVIAITKSILTSGFLEIFGS